MEVSTTHTMIYALGQNVFDTFRRPELSLRTPKSLSGGRVLYASWCGLLVATSSPLPSISDPEPPETETVGGSGHRVFAEFATAVNEAPPDVRDWALRGRVCAAKDSLVGFTTEEGGFYAIGDEEEVDGGGKTFRRYGGWTSAYFDEAGRVVATRGEQLESVDGTDGRSTER